MMEERPLVAHDHVRGQHTWDEFVDLDDEDKRELIDGELIEVDVPNRLHEWIVMRLGTFLTVWALGCRAGRVYGSGYKVRITENRGVMPDIQFYRRGNDAMTKFLEMNAKGMVEGRPDLAVEVVSASSRKYDRVTKLEWYALIGVPEHWVVDPDDSTLVRHVLRDGKYVTAEALDGDVTFAPETFPGLKIDLAELWKEPD